MNTKSASRDFYIGGFLVTLQAILGFVRYPTAPGIRFYIALIASIAITVFYFRRRPWARFGAILVAIFGILDELWQIRQPAASAYIALFIAVIFWLNRKTVKDQFMPLNAPNNSDE